ncbi:MAG: acyltransferase [Deltaproteobacteria bacterium]|nr:acyltransferase [Deltaproteobacteria bacterium]
MIQRDATKINIPALTGLRTIAAYFVFLYHYAPSEAVIGRFIYGIFRELHIGVTIFFVLSGFLITIRYYATTKISLPWLIGYFKNRFARIYPVFFCTMAATLIVQGNQHPISCLLNLTMTGGFLNNNYLAIPQAWSLTVEECFYMSAPFIFFIARKSKGLILSLVTVYLIGAVLIGLGLNEPGYFENISQAMLRTYFGRGFEFFCGIYLGLFVLKNNNSKVLSRSGVAIFTYLGVAGIFIVTVLLSMIAAKINNTALSHPVGIFLNNFILPPCIAVLIYGLVSERTSLGKFLSLRIMVFLGKSSYTFYLLHVGILSGILLKYTPINNIELFVLINLISMAIYVVFEEPMQKFIKNMKLKFITN